MEQDEIITATVHNFARFELQAKLEDGTDIRIDPFVTDIFEWEHAHKLIGTWIFKGRWYEGKKECFLPTAIYSPLQKGASQ